MAIFFCRKGLSRRGFGSIDRIIVHAKGSEQTSLTRVRGAGNLSFSAASVLRGHRTADQTNLMPRACLLQLRRPPRLVGCAAVAHPHQEKGRPPPWHSAHRSPTWSQRGQRGGGGEFVSQGTGGARVDLSLAQQLHTSGIDAWGKVPKRGFCLVHTPKEKWVR